LAGEDTAMNHYVGGVSATQEAVAAADSVDAT
jgi:hypothetical protein